MSAWMNMSPLARIAVAAAVAAALQPSAALALHRCVGKDGKVTYTEFECAADAKKSAVTIKDSSGFESKKAGDAGKDAKAAPVVPGPSLARPAEPPKPVAVPGGAPQAVAAPAPAPQAKPGS